MTTAETAANVQVPDIGEHSSPVDGVGGTQESAPETAAAQPQPQTQQPEKPKLALYTFQPEQPEYGPPHGIPATRQQVVYDGPIAVPRTSAIVLPGTERWFFRQLRNVQERIERGEASPLQLPYFWLEHAGLDESVIDRIALLPAEQWEKFFAGWMRTGAAADGNLGE